MKDLGWRLFYLPFHILVGFGIVVLVALWFPAIVWFFVSDVIDEMTAVVV